MIDFIKQLITAALELGRMIIVELLLSRITIH